MKIFLRLRGLKINLNVKKGIVKTSSNYFSLLEPFLLYKKIIIIQSQNLEAFFYFYDTVSPSSYIEIISEVSIPDVPRPVIHRNSRKSTSKTVAFQTQPNISCCDHLYVPESVADDPTYPKCCLNRCRKPWTWCCVMPPVMFDSSTLFVLLNMT